MHLAGVQTTFVGHVVAQRVALQEIAVVEHQRVRHLGPRRGDQGGGAGKARGVHRAVGEVVVGKKVGVQIGGGNQAQMHLALVSVGQEGVRCGHVVSCVDWRPFRACSQGL